MTRPTVRESHHAQQARIHPHDLLGAPYTIHPPLAQQHIDRLIADDHALADAARFPGTAPADLIDGNHP